LILLVRIGVLEQEFVGDSGRRFVLAGPVSNTNYVWASIIRSDGTTIGLVRGEDFIILEDNVTLQISDAWDITSADTIEVITFNSPLYPGNVLGYRIV